MAENTFATIDDYIANYPPEIQERLRALRKVIREAAPDAEERMSWQMPTFFLHGNLVHFAVNKHHIGFYPAPSGVEAFLAVSPEYKGTKGSIHFPHNKPLPLDLVSRVVRLRMEENIRDAEERLALKKK